MANTSDAKAVPEKAVPAVKKAPGATKAPIAPSVRKANLNM